MNIHWVKSHKIILFTIFIFLVSIFWINPIREAPVDDDWAYALTVKNFIDTGRYVLHPWAAANFPFQAVWGTIFTWFLGYSFSTLRISTLVLTFVGLIVMYLFARDLKIKNKVAGLLVLVLLACPLFLKFSLSFMTDIPFLSLLILSAFLYWRAFLRNSIFYSLLASISCAAAILTRQIGMALLVAVIIYEIIYRRRNILGLFLPFAATIWQLQTAFLFPNWGMVMVREAQRIYLSDLNGLFISFLIRPAYILIYLSFFCFPFLIVFLRRKFTYKVLLLVSGYLFGSLILGKLSKGNMPFTFPYIPWAFGDLISWYPIIVRILITTVILFVAVIFGAALFSLRKQIKKEIIAGSGLGFICIIFLSLLFYSLVFYKLGDEYLLVFVPFLLLLLGYYFKTPLDNKTLFLLVLCSAIISIVISTARVKNDLVHGEAYWKSCEDLKNNGISVKDISCNWMWVSYYSYQEYIDQTKGVKHSNLNDFFKRWLPEKERLAKYVVTDSPTTLKGNFLVQDVKSYEIFPFSQGKIHIMNANNK